MASKDIELMAHLMRRAGFGATRQELEERVANGYEATVEELLDTGDVACLPDDVIRRFHTSMHEARLGDNVSAYWMYKIITSSNPLPEKITLFWHGILATGTLKLANPRSVMNQIDMLRRHGMGRLDDLLVELSKDPAMIFWLDNNTNHNGAINENYGRELLELFSMGIGNYTEDDVKECARAFTGWTMGNEPYMAVRASKDSIWPYSRIPWHFEYREDDHDDGEKHFLGETGRFNGEDVVEIICRQPGTARFIARHMYDFFVADEVPVPQWPYTDPVDPDAIDILVDSYVSSGHDIRSMLRTLFNSDFFKESAFARVRGPAELVAGTIKLSGGISRPTMEVQEAVAVAGFMGQMILSPPTVEGWHEGTEWIDSGALIERVNFAAKVMSDVERPGVRAIIDRLADMDGGRFTPGELVDECLDLMGPVPSDTVSRSALVEHVARQGSLSLRDHRRVAESETRVADLLGLIASTREYQLG